MDGLLFELAQVYTAGSTPALLPLPVPGLTGGPTVDAEVVMKKHRQVTGVLQKHRPLVTEGTCQMGFEIVGLLPVTGIKEVELIKSDSAYASNEDIITKLICFV